MALYAIGDLHLSLQTDKPMDIFGGWQDYVQRLEKNWRAVVTEDDTVVAIDKLTYRSDLKSAVPNYITEAE